jgi:hypothetical protein
VAPVASAGAPGGTASPGKVKDQLTPLEPAFYIEIFYCHACIWHYSWQKDTFGPLSKAGFHSLTGQFANGVIIRKNRTELDDWQMPVYVGPFAS